MPGDAAGLSLERRVFVSAYALAWDAAVVTARPLEGGRVRRTRQHNLAQHLTNTTSHPPLTSEYGEPASLCHSQSLRTPHTTQRTQRTRTRRTRRTRRTQRTRRTRRTIRRRRTLLVGPRLFVGKLLCVGSRPGSGGGYARTNADTLSPARWLCGERARLACWGQGGALVWVRMDLLTDPRPFKSLARSGAARGAGGA